MQWQGWEWKRKRVIDNRSGRDVAREKPKREGGGAWRETGAAWTALPLALSHPLLVLLAHLRSSDSGRDHDKQRRGQGRVVGVSISCGINQQVVMARLDGFWAPTGSSSHAGCVKHEACHQRLK